MMHLMARQPRIIAVITFTAFKKFIELLMFFIRRMESLIKKIACLTDMFSKMLDL